MNPDHDWKKASSNQVLLGYRDIEVEALEFVFWFGGKQDVGRYPEQVANVNGDLRTSGAWRFANVNETPWIWVLLYVPLPVPGAVLESGQISQRDWVSEASLYPAIRDPQKLHDALRLEAS
ncbi:hypothetical protein ACJ41O_012407 [Fusarium nematophilum]